MLQQLPRPVAINGLPAASIPQLRASNQKQQTLSVHMPQLQQPAKQSTASALHAMATQTLLKQTPQLQQPLRQSGAGMQVQADASPIPGQRPFPEKTGTVTSFGNGTGRQGRAPLSPCLRASPPYSQHHAVPSYNSTIAGTGSQRQKPAFANHRRPGPQLQPKPAPATQAMPSALKVLCLQKRPHSSLLLTPSAILMAVVLLLNDHESKL